MATVPMLTVVAGLLLLCTGLLALWLRLGEKGDDDTHARRSASRSGGPVYWALDLIALAQATGRDLYSDQYPPRQPGAPRIQAVSG